MGAFMDSARKRKQEGRTGRAPIAFLRSVSAPNKKSKKSAKQKRKREKQKQKIKSEIRKEKLEYNYRLKLARDGAVVDGKKLKKYLKTNLKKPKKEIVFLKSNDLKKLRSIQTNIPGTVLIFFIIKSKLLNLKTRDHKQNCGSFPYTFDRQKSGI